MKGLNWKVKRWTGKECEGRGRGYGWYTELDRRAMSLTATTLRPRSFSNFDFMRKMWEKQIHPELKTLEWDILNPDNFIWVPNVHTFFFFLNRSF